MSIFSLQIFIFRLQMQIFRLQIESNPCFGRFSGRVFRFFFPAIGLFPCTFPWKAGLVGQGADLSRKNFYQETSGGATNRASACLYSH